MKGLDKEAKYLLTKLPYKDGSRNFIVQVAWPHLVGYVNKFANNQDRAEEVRAEYLAKFHQPMTGGKALGYRIYVAPYRTLEETNVWKIPNWPEFQYRTLCEMADFAATTISPTLLRVFRDAPGQTEPFAEWSERLLKLDGEWD